MTDIVLRGFKPEHQNLALEHAQRYAVEHSDAPSGPAGVAGLNLWTSHGLRGYLYWSKAREVVAVCTAIEKARKPR